MVVKDRDMASGKNTNENDRQVYLQTNELNHRVLKRWEIENYLYDKDVLIAYCAGNGLSFDEVAYDSYVTNINDQNLNGTALLGMSVLKRFRVTLDDEANTLTLGTKRSSAKK